jgi:hypothetical protein
MTRAKGGIVLEDGPGAGTYSTRRAPYFLRAVVDRKTGRVDLLDQLNDQPMPSEVVHVYEAEPGSIWDPDTLARTGTFLCPPPGASGRYHHRADVDGERVRTTEDWRKWARAEPAKVPTLDGITLEPRPGAVERWP